MSTFQYRIISQSEIATYVEKKSKFIGYAFHCASISEIQNRLDEVKKEHHKARHHCYAYRLGLDKNNFRANDDGEPSGTAGRPILGQIDSHELADTLVIVVRYFGGIKLGASGLATAYKLAAKTVLGQCQIIDMIVTNKAAIRSDHRHMGLLLDHAKKLGLSIKSLTYEPFPKVELEGPAESFEGDLLKLKSRTLNISEEEATIHDDKNVFYIFED